MRYIILGFLLNELLLSNPLFSAYSWIEQEYKDFRTHPRVNKAYQLTKEGKTQEARALLDKVLTIDSDNQDAVNLLVKICIKEEDESCIDRYIHRAKDVNLGYMYLNKAQKAKESGEYDRAIEFAQQALKYKLKPDDTYFAKLSIVEAYIKEKKYREIDKIINRKELTLYELLKWSKISDNLNDSDYAYELASELPNKEEYLQWQVELLFKLKRYKEATQKVEVLYSINGSEENKKRLLYLYSLSNQNENIVDIYRAKLKDGCNQYALEYLLDYYKKNLTKKRKLLEKEYPYSCIPQPKRVILSLELIDYLKKQNPKKAREIAKEINSDVEALYHANTTPINQKRLLNFYQASGQNSKRIRVYKNILKRGCQKEALLSLLDYYRDNQAKEQEILQRYYPYSCLSKKQQTNLTLELINFAQKESQEKLRETLARVDIVSIDSSAYMNISHLYTTLKEYSKSIKYAKAYLLEYPDDPLVLKSIGYSYLKLSKKKLSSEYLSKASTLSPNDSELLKDMGYLYMELKESNLAIDSWSRYLELKKDAPIALELASLYYYEKKEYIRAEKILDKYEQSTDDYSSKYYLLKAKLAYKNGNCRVALSNYSKALEQESSEYDEYAYIHLLKECKEEDKAIKEMKKFVEKYPNRLQYRKELAYMYQREKKYPKAIENFKYIAQKEPMEPKNYTALGYAYKQVGRDDKSSDSFKKAIDMGDDKIDPKELKSIKREIHASKRLHAYMAQSVRLDSYKSKKSLSPINRANYDGFGSFQLSYQPRFLPKNTTLFAEVLHNHKNISKSVQPSVGIRVKPIEDKNLYISAQKMIKGGSLSRDEVLLRATMGISSSSKEKNIYQNLYLDGGYFTKKNSIIGYGNYEIGKRYKISKNATISPYLTTGGSFNNDNEKRESVTNLDIGVGVALDIKSDETKYEDVLFINRVKLEARGEYAGNSEDKQVVKLQWEFLY